jgi:mxaK protein
VAATYNIGNLHLREALELESRGELQNQPQAAELAKRHFRAALRVDPTHWPSKYNLERVLHLAPEAGDDTVAPGHAADRVVTSLRGFTLGLP